MALDPQLVEFSGRNWLASQLQKASIEVARPERDRGIDLIAYIDRDERLLRFIAVPIQMKAATHEVFSLNAKYAKFPGLLLVYVWNLEDPAKTKCFALVYSEALSVAEKLGWTRTDSWLVHGSYSTTRPSKRLRDLLQPYEMTDSKWWSRVTAQ